MQRRQWQPTPALLPGKSLGERSPVGCSPWGNKESDMTERLHFHFSLPCIGEGNGNPLQYSCLENPRDGGAWWAAIYGAHSRTWLKRLSNSNRQHYTIPHSIIHLLSPNFCSLFHRLDNFYWLTFNSALNSSFSKNNFQVIAKISYLLTQCIHLFMQVLEHICNVF